MKKADTVNPNTIHMAFPSGRPEAFSLNILLGKKITFLNVSLERDCRNIKVMIGKPMI